MQLTQPLKIEINDVLKALRFNETQNCLTADTKQLITDLSTDILNVTQPKMVLTPILNICKFEPEISLENCNLLFKGDDILRHLKNCTGVILLAVTLGNGIDAFLSKLAIHGNANFVIADAAANVAIENAANIATKYISDFCSEEKLFITNRFSPGYGDFSINIQEDFLAVLNAQRQIGVVCGSGGLMTPQKSITAVIGVSNIPVTGTLAGCKTCALRNNCEYKKRGVSCGN
ncbi:MAG: hypothetical protein RR052_03395 [Oscillospiraceae bacterium]